jgi:poly(3-hydroxybutyrate) depolymerase
MFKYCAFSHIVFLRSNCHWKNKTEIAKHELSYALHRPENTKEKKPLIIFLHGSGEKELI